MVQKFGNTEEQVIFYHPVTNKHLGLAKLVFELVKSAQAFVNKYNGTSVMGKVLRVFLDPFGKECKKLFTEFTTDKKQSSIPEEHSAVTPTESVSDKSSSYRKDWDGYSQKERERTHSERDGYENDWEKSSKSWDRDRRSDKDSYHRKYKSDRDRDHYDGYDGRDKDKEHDRVRDRDRNKDRDKDRDREPSRDSGRYSRERNFKGGREGREFSVSSVKSDSLYSSSSQSDVTSSFTTTTYNSSTPQNMYDPYYSG